MIMPVVSYGPRILACGRKKRRRKESWTVVAVVLAAVMRRGETGQRRPEARETEGEVGLWSIAQRAPFFFLLDEGTKKWTELRERSDILNCFHTDSVRAFF